MNRSQKKRACITNMSGDFKKAALATAQPQKLRAKDTVMDFQTLSAAGATFSAQRAKHVMTAC